MKEIVDLHAHTTYSDGTLEPAALIERAANYGVRVLSITDHDTVAAYYDSSTQEAAERFGVDIVPGIEISTADETTRMHILGLFVDPGSDRLQELVIRQNAARLSYALDVAELLRGNGWDIDAANLSPDTVITKALIADMVLANESNAPKIATDLIGKPTRGAFIERHMNPGGDSYVERKSTTPDDAIETIHYAGGMAIMAHPVANVHEGMTHTQLMRNLKKYGFDGIEAVYYYFSKSEGDREIDEVSKFVRLANRLDLLVSGGSDFHGPSPSLGNYVEVGFGSREHVFTTGDFALLSHSRPAA